MAKTKGGINLNSQKLFDFAIEILILIVIFIMPTIFDRRLGIVFSGTKTTWMRVFGLLILSVWAIKLIVTKKHRFIRTPLDWPVISFLLGTTIATLTSVHVYTSFVGFYGRYEGLTSWYLFGLFFFVITNYIKSFDQLKRTFITVTSAATLMAVYSIIQRHELDPYRWGGVVTWQRVIGTIGQPNFLAAYMLMAFFMGFALFLLKKNRAEGPINWSEQLVPLGYFFFAQATFVVMIFSLEAHNILLWYFGFTIITVSALLFAYTYQALHPLLLNLVIGLALVLNYICILYTQSRGGYMGLFTGASLFAIVAGRHWLLDNWKKVAVLGFVIVVITGITMSHPKYSPFSRFASEITTAKVESEEKAEETEGRRLELKGAAGSRGETWKSAFHIITDYPFFGIGPEVLKMIFPRYETELFRFKEAFHVKQDRCHNETFDVAVTKGLVTFLIYLWLLFVFFRVGWVKAQTTKDPAVKLLLAGLLAAALAFLVQNQFSFGVVAITSLFWMIWAMVMVIGEDRGEEKETGKEISWMDVPWLPIAGILLVFIFLVYVSFFSFRGDIWFKAGKVNIQLRRIPQAVANYERSLQVFPYEGGTVSHLGIAYLNLSRNQAERVEHLNKAIETLKYGNQIDAYNADNYYMLSKIYFMMFKMGDVKALSEAQNNAEIAIKIDPYYAEVYFMMGLIMESQDKLSEAAEYFEQAFFINPNLTQPMASLENLNRRRGKPEETLKVFEGARIKYADNLVILERVARLYIERGKLDEALAVCQDMLDLNPKANNAYILRAEIYMKRGALDKAFSDLQQVILSDPKNVTVHNGLGRVYLLRGDRQRAAKEFEQALILDPNNAYAKKMLRNLK
jgi:tetratricopeptide (TPR) repeat protein